MAWSQVSSEGGGQRQDIYVQIEEGKPKRLHAILAKGEEPRSYWTHWIDAAKRSVKCPGRSVCPACKAQVPARIQHSMNVYDYTEKKVKVLEKGNQVYEPIKMAYEINNNSLDKVDVVIKQIGKGRQAQYITTTMQMTSAIPQDGVGIHDLDALCKADSPGDIAKLLGAAEFNLEELDASQTETTVDILDEPKGSDEVVMPTGKYKGKPLHEIVKLDRNYVQWVKDNFTDEEIVEAANEALESTDRIPVEPKADTKVIKSSKDKLVKEALELVQEYQSKGGDIKGVTQLMKSIAKKIVLRDFTEIELEKFNEEMQNLIESLAYVG